MHVADPNVFIPHGIIIKTGANCRFKVGDEVRLKEDIRSFYLKNNKEYIVDAKVVEIPSYNQNDNKKHHYTIVLTVKLTDELYNKFMENESYLNDTVKVNIF